MKRLGFLLLAVITVSSVFAQKREVLNTWSYLKDDYLDDAYKSINKAIEHNQTKTWYKTWWYYGKTYQALATTDVKKYKALCDDCSDKAFDGYLKALKYNFIDEELKNLDLEKDADVMKFFKALNNKDTKMEDQKATMDILMTRLPALANGFVNDGVNAFQSKDFKNALEKFEKSLTISTLAMKVDTPVFYYASLAALNAKEWEKVVAYNTALNQLGYGKTNEEKVAVVQSLGMGLLNTGDTAKFVSVMEEGMEKYPQNSQALIIDMYNFYLDSDKEKALTYISKAIENNPENAQYYVIRGTLYEETKKAAKAKTEYTKALELEPENFDANYSMGAYFYNSAADTLEWANNNIPPTDMAGYDKVKKAADGLFKEAVPFLEKAQTLQGENVVLLQTLKTIYYRTGDLEKHDAVKAKLDELTQ